MSASDSEMEQLEPVADAGGLGADGMPFPDGRPGGEAAPASPGRGA